MLSPVLVARAVPPSAPPAANAPAAAPSLPDENQLRAQYESIAARLHPQTGEIRLPTANAVLHLGQDYYFLSADEARLVLVDGWGNPPDAATDVLGIVFPAGTNFYDPDAWGAVITYDATGYVSDDDANSTDYAALMQQMQAGEAEENQRRTASGYPTQHLVGWAEPPAYNRNTHSVVWARNIQLGGTAENTLNYDVRLLGRQGVLSLNMVGVMSQLAQTRQAAQRFAAQAEFTPGNRYADYQSGDRTAEYGVGGLIAAGAGVAVAQKAGLIAIILLFLKKVGIFIVAGLALLWGWLRRVIGRRREGAGSTATTAPQAAAAPEAETPPPQRSG